MFVRNAASLFLAVGLLSKDALAELITITQYASTCSAIYTTGTRSVTIVQSTTTVVPIPYDDAAWNGGTPFVLEIQPYASTDPLARRADLAGRSWVTLNGNTSTNPSSAGQYYIRGGQLMSINGSYVSTNLNVQNQPFSITNNPGSISTTFTFKDGVLNWTSPRFTGGKAKFCKSPVNLVDNCQVLCQFLGPAASQDSCNPIRLVAKSCEEVNPLSSSSILSTGTVAISTSVGMQSMSSAPSEGPPPPYTYQPPSSYVSLSSPVASTPTPYSSAPSSSAIPSASPVAPSSSKSSSSSSRPTSSVIVPPVYGSSSSPAIGPPIYGSPTPSPARTSSSVSSSASISFAPSGSPIGPLNPPMYGSTSSSSSSISSSVSISSGGIRSSASSAASSSSALGVPPIYQSPTPVSSSMSSSTTRSSTPVSSSSMSFSASPSISFAPSESRPPLYTPPAVYPSPTTSSSASSSSSVSLLASSSQAPPVVYPGDLSTSSPASSSPSSSTISSTSTTQTASTSSVFSPPIYTGSPPQPCPQGNNSMYIDAAGNAYTIYCNLDSVPSPYSTRLTLDFTSCIQRCDFDPQCGAVSHNGGNVCYLKPTPQSYVPADTQLAVRVAGAPAVYPGQSSSTLSSSTSSLVLPPIYEASRSSSVAQSSSSSSSSSMMSSSSSSQIPEQYQAPTTTTTSTTSSPMSSSTSSQVPDQYGQTTTSSSTSSSSSSAQTPEQYGQTTTTTTSTSSSSSVQVPDQYAQTTTSSSSSSIQIPDQYAQTTASSSSSSSSSSSAASSTIPYSSYLILPSPTPCNFGDPPDYDEDDSYCELDLPFSIQLYGVSSQRTFASSNGYIGLDRGSSQFQNNQFPYFGIPNNTIGPFFDDLMLYGKKNPRQGIYYQIDGGTKVTFEWYVGRSGQTDADKARLSQSIYHFTMAYDSAVPNNFVYTYYAVGSSAQQDAGVNGVYASVGIQGCKFLVYLSKPLVRLFRNANISSLQQWTAAASNKARRTPSATRKSRPARKYSAVGRQLRRRGRAQKCRIQSYRREGRRDRLMNVCSVAQRKSAVYFIWRAVGKQECDLLFVVDRTSEEARQYQDVTGFS
jgi:hypothetical protein